MIKGGHTYRFISDHLVSPRLVVDVDTGDVAQMLEYDFSQALCLYPSISGYTSLTRPTAAIMPPPAPVVELVDTSGLGPDAARCGGSSPSWRTISCTGSVSLDASGAGPPGWT